MNPVLPKVDAVIESLTQTVLALSSASKWADRARQTMSPFFVVGGPLKYWKWWRANVYFKLARKGMTEVPELEKLWSEEPAFNGIDAVIDLGGYSSINLTRVGTVGGPSPIKQQMGVATTAYNQIETALLNVNDLLRRVGEVRASLAHRS
jgi:hypothetical protein